MLPIPDETHVGILEEGRECVVAIDDFRDRLGVDALIRLHPEDFDALSSHGSQFVHFNLEVTTSEVGRRYGIVPILKLGQRLADGRELLPVIDPTQCRLGTCTEVIQRVPTGEVTTDQFAHSLASIRTPQQLRNALLRRYARMFPDLTDKKIVLRGCAVTRIILDDP